MVPPGNPDALAAALIAMLSDLPGVREMGAAARHRTGLFAVEKFVADLETHYRSVVRA